MSEDEIVVRWGGEEFVFIVEKEDFDSAKQFAECIRQDIENYSFDIGKENINITMSFGVSTLDSAVTIEENVRHADERLYIAKNSGRNRVE